MDDFILYEYTLKDGFIHSIEGENIYEALEQIVRVEGIHPSKIKSIKEKWISQTNN